MDAELAQLERQAQRSGATFLDRIKAVCDTYEASNNDLTRARKLLLAIRKRSTLNHKTMDHRVLKVMDMTDSHLMNTAAMYYRDRLLNPHSGIDRAYSLQYVTTIDGVRRRCSVRIDRYANELWLRGFRSIEVLHSDNHNAKRSVCKITIS